MWPVIDPVCGAHGEAAGTTSKRRERAPPPPGKRMAAAGTVQIGYLMGLSPGGAPGVPAGRVLAGIAPEFGRLGVDGDNQSPLRDLDERARVLRGNHQQGECRAYRARRPRSHS